MEIVIFSNVYFHLFAAVCGLTISISFVTYELYSENEINGNTIFSFDTSSAMACVALCDRTFGCLSVNFHEDNAKCLLTDYYPTDNTRSSETSVGWKIYFRRNFVYSRNTNFTVTVSKSRDDVTNDVGVPCGTYYGPAIDKAPFRLTIECESTIYGKFLTIKHEMADVMMLCEVIVQTP